MVGLRLLLRRLYLIYRTAFQLQSLCLLCSELCKMLLIAVLRQGKPVHHVTCIMDGIERLELALDRIEDLYALEPEMHRLAGNRFKTVLERCITVKKHRRLVHREVFSTGILAETAVVGDDSAKVLGSGLHTQDDRTVHERHILFLVLKRNDACVHRV